MGATVGYTGATHTITVTSAATPATCVLTVQITTSGTTVWGKVTAAYGSTSQGLSTSSQTLSVPCGTAVTLREVPISSASWGRSAAGRWRRPAGARPRCSSRCG